MSSPNRKFVAKSKEDNPEPVGTMTVTGVLREDANGRPLSIVDPDFAEYGPILDYASESLQAYLVEAREDPTLVSFGATFERRRAKRKQCPLCLLEQVQNMTEHLERCHNARVTCTKNLRKIEGQ